MPEFILMPMHQCQKLNIVSVQVGRYIVSRVNDYMFNRCTCDGFKYRRRCKHLAIAQERVCVYHELTHGKPKEDGICPLCDGPTEVVKVAV